MPISIAGTSGITFPDSVQQTNAVTNTGGSPPYYAARAWVNFDGATGAIRASANILSVTRTGTGRYTVAFSSAMPDANYCVLATSSSSTSLLAATLVVGESTVPTTTQFTLRAVLGTSAADPDFCNVVVFR